MQRSSPTVRQDSTGSTETPNEKITIAMALGPATLAAPGNNATTASRRRGGAMGAAKTRNENAP